jgi:5-methylcytosine-specific restriction protein B
MIERLYDAKVDGSESNDRGRTDVAKYVGAGRATHIYSVYKDFYLYALVKGAFSSSERLNYVIIIDEINRGNVSSIFGELITLIETDKRIGEVNELTAVLPYSRDRFGVPSNLYIIGTMNTADRSVEALDTALRRRFSFTEMPPKYDLEGLNYHFAGTTGSSILETINKRIRKLLDRDHLIGHSYFLIDNGEDPHEKLMRSFYSNIIPLLQEYFYGDYAKIGAVLGQGFIYSEDEGEEAIFGSGYEELDYNEKQEYFIRDFREQADIKASINGTETKLTFELAVKLLLNT